MPVARSLQDGWDFRPHWRLQIIESLLHQVVAAPDRESALADALITEPDPFVRQGARFRLTGRCASTTAFSWAFRCAHENARTGSLSMLKAMVLARVPAQVIARELGTERRNVATAEKLFFDVRQCLENRMFLRCAVVNPAPEGVVTPELSRARRFLTVAFEEGPDELLKILRGNEDASDEALEVTAKKLEAITSRRALEFVRGLDRDGVPATEDDLKRYVLARGMRSREAATTAVEQNDKLKEFGLGLVKLISEPRTNWDAKVIAGAAKILPVREMKEVMVRQLEERAIVQAQAVETASSEGLAADPLLAPTFSEPTEGA